MKILLMLGLAFFAVSCAKKEIKPTTSGTQVVTNHYYIAITGSLDTSKVYLNGTPIKINATQQLILINKGDDLEFYCTSKSGPFDLYLWCDENSSLPVQTEKYFYATKNIIVTGQDTTYTYILNDHFSY